MRISIAIIILSMVVSSLAAEENPQMLVYIGAYSGPKSQGIYVARMNAQTGELSQPQLAAKAQRASFVAIHPNHKFLYAVNEVADANGMKTGAVCSYAIDASTGILMELNHQSSAGKGPAFVGLDRDGKNALVANYGDGVVAVIPIADDGTLKTPTAIDHHQGS